MRVALLTLAVPIPGHPSVGLYNIAQCQGIINLGHDARIITCAPFIPKCAARLSRACSRHRLRPYATRRGDVEIRTTRVPIAYTKSLREQWTTRSPEGVQRVFTLAVQRAVNRELHMYEPDLVVAHGVFPWSDLVNRYARMQSVRTIAVEHSGSDIERIVKHGRLRDAYRKRAQHLHRVYAVNQRMANAIQGIGLANVHDIQNGITDCLMQERQRERRSGFTILCAGSYVERKGHAYLLKAFAAANLSDARLRLIGKPPPEIKDLIERLGISSRVSILPEMTQSQLRHEMLNADLFALPSADEAFGLVFAESLSVGTPILLGEGAGVLELPHVRKSAWVVPPRNTDAIREALLKATKAIGHESSQNLQRATDWVRTHLTWEQNARTLLELPSVHAR
jgi:teichuronic acid biosynthesis glycosyltransferase TuaC